MGSGHTGREKVRERIEARGADLEFLPSYSPDLNPIEEAFSNDVTNARPVPCGEYPDHVEAYGIEIRFALGEVLIGEPAEGVACFRGVTASSGSPKLVELRSLTST